MGRLVHENQKEVQVEAEKKAGLYLLIPKTILFYRFRPWKEGQR